MRFALKLEAIGENTAALLRDLARITGDQARIGNILPWVARVSIREGRVFREFVRGQKDYASANSIGSRGVWLHYFLEPGIYDVYERLSWQASDRYFLEVLPDGTAHRMMQDEIEWLKEKSKNSESAS